MSFPILLSAYHAMLMFASLKRHTRSRLRPLRVALIRDRSAARSVPTSRTSFPVAFALAACVRFKDSFAHHRFAVSFQYRFGVVLLPLPLLFCSARSAVRLRTSLRPHAFRHTPRRSRPHRFTPFCCPVFPVSGSIVSAYTIADTLCAVRIGAPETRLRQVHSASAAVQSVDIRDLARATPLSSALSRSLHPPLTNRSLTRL